MNIVTTMTASGFRASGIAASGRRLFLPGFVRPRLLDLSLEGAMGLLVRAGNARIENIVDSSVRADQGLITFPGQAGRNASSVASE